MTTGLLWLHNLVALWLFPYFQNCPYEIFHLTWENMVKWCNAKVNNIPAGTTGMVKENCKEKKKK
jgi:hypothetical protein